MLLLVEKLNKKLFGILFEKNGDKEDIVEFVNMTLPN